MKSSLRLVLGSVAALGLAGVFVLSFIQVDKVPRIGLPSAIEHLIAYALVCLVLTLLLGARLQKIEQANGYSAQRVSPSLGVVLKPWGDSISLYANYMEGLQPGQTVGVGYTNEYAVGRLWRDAKLYEIGAGTSEIRRMLIGRELFAETA